MPFSLNASECLSYLTIEQKSPVSKSHGKMMRDCFFGCDRCQEVCPFNEGGKDRKIILPSCKEILSMHKELFKEKFGKTSLARAGFEKIKTNIRAVFD